MHRCRLLWDEAMGNGASSWLASHPGGFMVSLLGNDHVKFGCGAAARCARTRPTLTLTRARTPSLNTCTRPDADPHPHQVRTHARRGGVRAHGAHQPALGGHHARHRPSPPRAAVDGAAAALRRERRGGRQRGMAKAPLARRVAAAYALAHHLRGGTPAGSGRTYRAEMRALAACAKDQAAAALRRLPKVADFDACAPPRQRACRATSEPRPATGDAGRRGAAAHGVLEGGGREQRVRGQRQAGRARAGAGAQGAERLAARRLLVVFE